MRGLGSNAQLAGPPWAMGLPGGPGFRPLGAANIDWTPLVTSSIQAASAVSVAAIDKAKWDTDEKSKTKKKHNKKAKTEAKTTDVAPETPGPAEESAIPTWAWVTLGLVVVGGGVWYARSRKQAA